MFEPEDTDECADEFDIESFLKHFLLTQDSGKF